MKLGLASKPLLFTHAKNSKDECCINQGLCCRQVSPRKKWLIPSVAIPPPPTLFFYLVYWKETGQQINREDLSRITGKLANLLNELPHIHSKDY